MTQELRVAVIGAGSWGTTVANLASRNAPTVLWSRRPEVADEINTERSNARYLPDLRLHRRLSASADLEAVVAAADVVVMGVPTHGFREILGKAAPYVRPWVPVLSLSKGFEQGSLLRMTEVIAEVLPDRPVGVLTGPNIAREIVAGQAAAAVVGMEDETVARSLQRVFASGLFRVYTNPDVVGCEVGGALKNVIAIATGVGQGLGVGDNTRAMVITRGLAELTRLGVAMGGQAETFSGLAGMGDLMATCMSPHSRNRTLGERLGSGETLDEIMEGMNQVAEGVRTARLVLDLAERHGVEMPIHAEIHGMVHHGRTAMEAYRGLVALTPGSEADIG
ncbi:MAG: NAD(P)H-dependent glycerol-3-phosphate dehydrogenase [Actinomycetota bacterium]